VLACDATYNRPMDADILRRHPDRVEEHVKRGRHQISDQRLRIARLAAAGRDASWARALLETLLRIQAIHEQHRNQLRRQVAAH
jgi:hypothetical protein